jgi:hypothetical protein
LASSCMLSYCGRVGQGRRASQAGAV